MDIASIVDLDSIFFSVDLKPDGKLHFTELHVMDGSKPRVKMMYPESLKYAIETEKVYKVVAYKDQAILWELENEQNRRTTR